jgi:hypothetical protein
MMIRINLLRYWFIMLSNFVIIIVPQCYYDNIIMLPFCSTFLGRYSKILRVIIVQPLYNYHRFKAYLMRTQS